MSDPLSHNPRTLPEPLGLGDRPVAQIVVTVHSSGSLSVQGPIQDKAWVVAALTEAIAAVRGQRRDGEIIVPARDVEISAP